MRAPLVIHPRASPATASLIFLHGLGDTGYGWAPAMTAIANRLPSLKIVLPHAPARPITLNGGMEMPAWYDIARLDRLDAKEDTGGMRETIGYLGKLIDEQEGLKVFIGGFSQGAAMALATALSAPRPKVGGVVALSGYLPSSLQYASRADACVFMGHGTADEIVQYQYGQSSAQRVQGLTSGKVAFKSYPGVGHSASEEELEDVIAFLKARMHEKDEL